MKNLVLSILILSSLSVLGQNVFINGTVTDSKSGESILSANIYDKNTYQGTTTNNYGFYVLNLQKGKVLLTCSYVGYSDFQLELNVNNDTTINISLEQNLAIEEVVVSNISPRKTVESTQMSQIELKVMDIKSAPALLGEVDILKTLQTLPGVQGGTEGSSGFYVRGGAPDQNLILLDGVPVYNASHLFGFFSVFNADAIKNVTLIKGGFPARYGGRISSVVDIRMKEGDMKEFHGEGSIGLISSKLTLEGPIKKDTTSFLISGRRTYYDLITYPFQYHYNNKYDDGGTTLFGAYFYDVNAKINHKLSDKDRLFLSTYIGKDRFYIKEEYSQENDSYSYSSKDYSGILWGNITAAARWNHRFSGKLFSNLTVLFSDYTFTTYSQNESYSFDSINEYSSSTDLEYYSRIRNYGLKYEFDYPLSSKHYLRFGFSNTFYHFSPGVGVFSDSFSESGFDTDTSVGTKNIPGNETFIYFEDEYTISDRLKTNLGVHVSSFQLRDKTYFSPEPRISVRYLLTDNLSLKASYVWMSQYINLLTNSTIGLPTDLWIPSTGKLLPQKSWQSALGLAYNLNNTYQFTVEAYYKKMNNMVEFAEGYGFFNLGINDLDEITTQGSGYSYGAEFMLQKSEGKLRGWLSYTLSWSNRKFAEISYGQEFPFKYDRRHSVAIVTNYDLKQNINIGLGWTYYTGNAFSFADQEAISVKEIYTQLYTDNSYQTDIDTYDYIENRNNYRMPAYHRLDVGINFKKKLKRTTRTWSFGAYNAYNRKNAFSLYERTEYDESISEEIMVMYQLTLFTIIPYLRYSLKF